MNRDGYFNSSFADYKNPNIVNAPTLRAVSAYLNDADIRFFPCDYTQIREKIDKGTFIYLDPPYDPVSSTANFTGYAKRGFDKKEQIRLRCFCDELTDNGIKFMLTNSASEFIKGLYTKYDFKIVRAKRTINSVGTKRGEVDELVIRNYA